MGRGGLGELDEQRFSPAKDEGGLTGGGGGGGGGAG